MARARLAPALVAAIALHAGCLLLVARHWQPAPVPAVPDADVTVVEVVEWETGETALERVAELLEPVRVPAAPREPRVPTFAPAARGEPPPADSAVAETAQSRPEASVSEHDVTAPTEVAEPPRVSLAEAGYTEPSLWALPDTRPEASRARSERRLEKNLTESAMRLDYQRSLGIEGPVVAALNQSAYGLAPPRSRAVVSVVVNGDGQVSSVEVLEVNDGMARWRQVSQKVLAALRSKALRVPPGQRVELVFEVESKVLMPSGRKPQRGVSILGVPLGQTDDKHEPMVKILEPHAGIDKVKVPLPGNPDEEAEIPRLRVGIDVLTVNPDPSDWGGHERQVVHSKLIRQRVL